MLHFPAFFWRPFWKFWVTNNFYPRLWRRDINIYSDTKFRWNRTMLHFPAFFGSHFENGGQRIIFDNWNEVATSISTWKPIFILIGVFFWFFAIFSKFQVAAILKWRPFWKFQGPMALLLMVNYFWPKYHKVPLNGFWELFRTKSLRKVEE